MNIRNVRKTKEADVLIVMDKEQTVDSLKKTILESLQAVVRVRKPGKKKTLCISGIDPTIKQEDIDKTVKEYVGVDKD